MFPDLKRCNFDSLAAAGLLLQLPYLLIFVQFEVTELLAYNPAVLTCFCDTEGHPASSLVILEEAQSRTKGAVKRQHQPCMTTPMLVLSSIA